MEKSLITSLLRIYHSQETRFRRSKGLETFRQEYNIGYITGMSIHFNFHDKIAIRALLLQVANIDADITQPDQWEGLSRAASLTLGSNEKLTSVKVRDHRIAVKHLPGHYLALHCQHLTLPEGCNLDINWQWLVKHSRHTHILVVENWETFEHIHQVQLDFSLAGDNPLVVFRGSPIYSPEYVIKALEALQKPVTAFVDFDPAGLVIAQSLPGFQQMITPPLPLLIAHLQVCKNHQRYQEQLPQTARELDNSPHSIIQTLWQLLQSYGVALPQETFIQHTK